MTQVEKLSSVQDLERLQTALVTECGPDQPCITVSDGTCCQAYGSEQVIDALKTELAERGLADKVRLKTTGCHGFCAIEPIVVVEPAGVLYQRVKFKNAAEIVEKTVQKHFSLKNTAASVPNSSSSP